MLQISSYNCQSSKRNVGGIRKLCDSSDIVFLLEHWLFPSELASLNNIHCDFSSFGLSSINPSVSLIRGRPFGGVAVLWRNSLAPHVKPVTYGDDRIIGLECNLSGIKMLFVGVYLPYNTQLNFDRYVYYLAKLKTIVDDFDSPYVALLGDFNADIVKGTEFGKELQSFCNESHLSIVDVMHLPRTSTTHFNDGHSTESWLDHIVCTEGFKEVIIGVGIDQSILSSDHFPVFMKIKIRDCNINFDSHSATTDERWVVDWESLEPNELRAFTSAVEESLDKVAVPYDLLIC